MNFSKDSFGNSSRNFAWHFNRRFSRNFPEDSCWWWPTGFLRNVLQNSSWDSIKVSTGYSFKDWYRIHACIFSCISSKIVRKKEILSECFAGVCLWDFVENSFRNFSSKCSKNYCRNSSKRSFKRRNSRRFFSQKIDEYFKFSPRDFL